MKPKSTLRSFLALAGSSLLAISYTHAQTNLANFYTTNTLDVTSPTTIDVARNFSAFWDGPVIGGSTLTVTGAGLANSGGFNSGQLSLINNPGNTFSGNIVVDGATLRIAGNPFATGVAAQGFIAPNMTSGSTITVRPGGTFTIDDNVTNGYIADRFGTAGNRPAVNLAGGTLSWQSRNVNATHSQTLGALTSSSGQGTVWAKRNNGTPTLTFDSLAINSGSLLSFNGDNLGTAAAGVSQIKFNTAPTLTNGIIAGARYFSGAPGTSDLATYGANGVTALTTFDLSAADINAATSTQNVRIPLNTAAVALTNDVTVNSLTFSGLPGTFPGWSLGGNKLTIVSGMLLRNGSNENPNIQNGTLTAGNGTDDIDLHVIVAQNNMTIGAVIADNALSAVTLVKSGDGRSLTLSGGADNTYTGGTKVIGGTLSTGNVANRTYLGTGQVTVDGISVLNLGQIGATSNASGDDYTAINGGRISISNNNHGSVDTFNIGANSIISGASGSGTGLASLTRGTNVTLAADSIIGHNQISAPLNLATGTIQNLGTNADLYYGLAQSQGNAGGQITIGTGTAFKGISGMQSPNGNVDWSGGTINITSGTTDVYFQSNNNRTNTPDVFGLAGASTVVNLLGAGTVDINVLGRVNLNSTTLTFGDSTASEFVRFVSENGGVLNVAQAAGMGSGNGVASAFIGQGGLLTIGNAAALNGAVTVDGGGQFNANNASGLTGTGALTFNQGSIINVGNALGFSGAQASAASLAPGTIIRLSVDNYGEAGTTLDSIVGGSSPIYQLGGNNHNGANPSVLDTTIMTLNKSGGGVGGILTNTTLGGSMQLEATANGRLSIGPNGGIIAATTNTTLTVAENSILNGNLELGSTTIIDGAPKLGAVTISGAMDLGGATRTVSAIANTGTLQITGVISNGGLTKNGAGTLTLTNTSNSYTGGTTVDAGILKLGNNNTLGSTSGTLTVNTGGTLDLDSRSLTVGNLTGTGGTISGASGARTLTIGQGDTGGGNYQGTITNGTGGTTALTKTGTGTITLSGDNSYTGITTVSAGTLIINGNSSTALGAVSVSNIGTTLGGTGIIGGSTTMNSGTILSPGTSPGTLTFLNNLTLNNGSTYFFEGGDLTVVTGTLDLNAGWILSLGSGFQDGGSVTLFTYGTLAASPDLDPTFNLGSLGFTPSGLLTLTDSGGSITLNGISILAATTPIPEPSSVALLGALGTMLLLRRRRTAP